MQPNWGHPAAQGKHGWLGIVFEAVSAFGTVGLSVGITGGLDNGWQRHHHRDDVPGRLGPLCLAMHLMQPAVPGRVSYPEEDVAVG